MHKCGQHKTTQRISETYVETQLAPTLSQGDVVIDRPDLQRIGNDHLANEGAQETDDHGGVDGRPDHDLVVRPQFTAEGQNGLSVRSTRPG